MIAADHQRRAVLERFFNADRALRQISTHPESLTEGATQLLDAAQPVLREAATTFLDKWKERERLPEPERDRHLSKFCSQFGDVLRQFESTVIPALEGAEPENIPFEMENYLLQEVKSAAPTWNIKGTVLASEHRYNYAIGYHELSRWQNTVATDGAAGNVAPQRFIHFTIPRATRDSMSLHAVLLGHEIGHLREWHSPLATDDRFLVVFPEDRLDADRFTIPLIAVKDSFNRTSRSWMAEFVADVYAALLLGPGALFALDEIAAAVNSYVDTATHPSTPRRIAIMVRVLDRSGFLNVEAVGRSMYEHLLAYVDLSRGALDRQPEEGSVPVMSLVWNCLRPLMEDLIEACSERIGSPFEAREWWAVERAARLLEGGRPCGELEMHDHLVATPPAVILNAGWLIKATALASLVDELGFDPTLASSEIRANHVLEQLVLKSFEISSFRQANQWT